MILSAWQGIEDAIVFCPILDRIYIGRTRFGIIGRMYFAAGFIILRVLLKGLTFSFGKDKALFGDLALKSC